MATTTTRHRLYLPAGDTWWIQYFVRGERRRESSTPRTATRPEQLLHKRLGEIAIGRYVGLASELVTIGHLIDLVIEDYRFEARSLAVVEWRAEANLKHLRELPAQKFTAAEVRRYVVQRRAESASDATINRELAIIRRGFTLARQSDPPLVHRAPYIPQLEEDNVRQGFLEPEQYERLLTELPDTTESPVRLRVSRRHAKGRTPKAPVGASGPRGPQDPASTLSQTKGKVLAHVADLGRMERWILRQRETLRA